MLLLHAGLPLEPHDLWTAWAFDPLVIAGLTVSAWLYSRGATDEHGIAAWERRCYWAGWLSLVIALVSPLHPMGEVLFSAHMAQHEVLMLISAPLLVLGRPLLAFLWGLPVRSRKRTGALLRSGPVQSSWRWLSHPVNAWWIHGLALWAWHAPQLFQATVESDVVHTFQHLSFLGSALLFWWALLRGRHAASNYGMAVVYVFTTAVHSSVLGALLTFSRVVWYPIYEGRSWAWGLSALEDQQLGGVIMWVPASLVFIAAGLALFARWIAESDRRRMTTAMVALALLLSTSCVTEVDLQRGEPTGAKLAGGNPDKGKAAIERYGCGSCHTIPGVTGANANVGPSLARIATRTYIAGVLANTSSNLERWILDPPAIDDKTAMPKLGVTPQDARDIAAYLYTLY